MKMNLVLAVLVCGAYGMIGCADVEPVERTDEQLSSAGSAAAGAPATEEAATPESSETDAEVVEEIEVGTGLIDKGTCGDYYHPSVRGGEAAWSLACSGGNIYTVSAWVKDTAADGKCARVKMQCGNGDVSYSPKACPNGQKKSFSKTCAGRTLNAWLQVIN